MNINYDFLDLDLTALNEFQLLLFNYLKDFSDYETIIIDCKNNSFIYKIGYHFYFTCIEISFIDNVFNGCYLIVNDNEYYSDYQEKIVNRQSFNNITESLLDSFILRSTLPELRKFLDNLDKYILMNEFILKYLPKTKEKRIKI